MRNLMLRLWKDDAGIVALEYLLVATIVGLGLVVGLGALSYSINSDLTELANAILAVDAGYVIFGQISVADTPFGRFAPNQVIGTPLQAPILGSKDGSQAFRAPFVKKEHHGFTGISHPSNISVIP
jgi:Flp pilus assembly pilin Flp